MVTKTVKEVPVKEIPRKGAEHITVPIQLRKLESTAEKGDWHKVGKLGSETKSLEVGKRAVDLAVEAKEWGRSTVEYICDHFRNPVIIKYAIDKVVEAKDWDTFDYISRAGPRGTIEYGNNQLKKATTEDVDKFAKAGKWYLVERALVHGTTEVAKYAQEQFKTLTTEDVDEFAKTEKWYLVDFISQHGTAEVAKYAKEKYAQHEKDVKEKYEKD